tara:strand:- start:1726 stop:2280 length:555 start_codon:yes stop_codon:yes gene_type:complete
MAPLERLYTVPLRKRFLKGPKYRRTRKAVIALREFIQKHMKSEDVRIGSHLNLEMWKHGKQNPPSRIKVKAIKDTEKVKDKDVEIVRVELPHIKIETKKEDKKDDKKKTDKKEEKVETPKIEDKKEETKETKQEKEKKEVLEHPDKEKPTVTTEKKQATKEQETLQKTKKIISATEKPIHEKKK